MLEEYKMQWALLVHLSLGQQSPREAHGILERKIQEEVIVLQPWSPQKWAQLDGNKPDVLSRKKPSVLHLREMVTALKIQGAMGKGWGWEDSHGLGLFFMTQRVRTETRGWKPGYGFELGIRICFLTEPSSRSWDGGLRRNRVLFLERFKQSRWPPMSLLILCLYDFAGSCPSPQSCCRHMSSVLGW